MEYHIYKCTRIYTGYPYCGCSSGHHALSFTSLAQAKAVQYLMNYRNPVGWDIYKFNPDDGTWEDIDVLSTKNKKKS